MFLHLTSALSMETRNPLKLTKWHVITPHMCLVLLIRYTCKLSYRLVSMMWRHGVDIYSQLAARFNPSCFHSFERYSHASINFQVLQCATTPWGHATNIVVTHTYKGTKILHHPSVTPFICLCLNSYTMGIELAEKVERTDDIVYYLLQAIFRLHNYLQDTVSTADI